MIRTRREITLSFWAPNFVRKNKFNFWLFLAFYLKITHFQTSDRYQKFGKWIPNLKKTRSLLENLSNFRNFKRYFQRLVQFTESIPEFSGLRNLEHGLEDQIRLLSFSVTGLICLLASRTYDNHTETIFYRSHRKIDNFRTCHDSAIFRSKFLTFSSHFGAVLEPKMDIFGWNHCETGNII